MLREGDFGELNGFCSNSKSKCFSELAGYLCLSRPKEGGYVRREPLDGTAGTSMGRCKKEEEDCDFLSTSLVQSVKNPSDYSIIYPILNLTIDCTHHQLLLVSSFGFLREFPECRPPDTESTGKRVV